MSKSRVLLVAIAGLVSIAIVFDFLEMVSAGYPIRTAQVVLVVLSAGYLIWGLVTIILRSSVKPPATGSDQNKTKSRLSAPRFQRKREINLLKPLDFSVY